MKVLFLDIDGVLNSWAWQDRVFRPPHFGQLPTWQKIAEEAIDPSAVGRLNHIVRATGCMVVLSSSWRKVHTLPEVTRILRYRGFDHRLFAATPSIHEPMEQHRTRPIERGLEIKWWLDAAGLPPADCVILDDDADMGPLMHRLVQTEFEVGLTDDDVARAIYGLGGVSDAA